MLPVTTTGFFMLFESYQKLMRLMLRLSMRLIGATCDT